MVASMVGCEAQLFHPPSGQAGRPTRLSDAPSEAQLKPRLDEVLQRLEEEVTTVLSTESSAFKAAVNTATENYALWAAVAGLVGVLLGGLDPSTSCVARQ
jgi:hypothetical protein